MIDEHKVIYGGSLCLTGFMFPTVTDYCIYTYVSFHLTKRTEGQNKSI